MKIIKFLDNNTVALKNVETDALGLNYNDSIEILEKVNYTRYYDKGDKRFNSWPKFTIINGNTYA